MKRSRALAILTVCLILFSSGCAAGKDGDRYSRLKLSDRPVALSELESGVEASSTEEVPESDPDDVTESESSSEFAGETLTDPVEPSSDPRTGTESASRPTSTASPSPEPSTSRPATESSESPEPSTVAPTEPSETPAPSSTESSGLPDPYSTGVVLSNGTRIYAIDAQVMTLIQDTFPAGQFVGKGIISVCGGRDEHGPLLDDSEYQLYPSPEYDSSLYTVRPADGFFTFHRPGTYKILVNCQGLQDSFYLTFVPPESSISYIGICVMDYVIAKQGSYKPIYWSAGSDMIGIPMGIVYNDCTYDFVQNWIGTQMSFVPEWNVDRSAILLKYEAFLVYGALPSGDVINITSSCTFSPDIFSPEFKESLLLEDQAVTVRYGSLETELWFCINDRP